MHERNSRQLYYTFLDFYISNKQTLMLHHFIESLYHTFVEYYIDQEHILVDKVIC